MATATALELTSITLDEASGPAAHLTICFTTIESNRYVIESAEVAEPATWVEIPSTATMGDDPEKCLELVQTNGMSFSRLRLVSGFVRTIEAEGPDGSAGILVDATSIAGLEPADWARYDNIDLDGVGTVGFVLATTAPGKRIQLRIGSPTGTVVAELTADSTAGLSTFAIQSAGVLPVTGVHTVYLTTADAGEIVIDRFTLHVEGPIITIPGTYGSGPYGEGACGD